MKKTFCIMFIVLFATSSSLFSQTNDPDWVRRYDCRLKSGSILIDGIGDEFAWQIAQEVVEFSRFTSANYKGEDLEVPNRTTAKMLWDEDNLYFLIAVNDPDIWSTMTEGDKECLCREETIEIFIDPDGDGKNYAEIHINCLNTINDICIPQKPGAEGFTDEKGEPVNWDNLYAWTMEGMQHAIMNYGTINDKSDVDNGSVFEFAMPWKGFGKVAGSAKIPPKPGDIWRINVNRYERPTREHEDLSGWAPLERRSYHVPERFGYVTFVNEY